MFDLNQAVSSWRTQLADSAALGDQNLDELEGHLRESIERLKKTSLSTEEAFLVATHRLGAPAALSAVFAKANPAGLWRERSRWMLAGVLAFTVILCVARVGSHAMGAGAAYRGWRDAGLAWMAVGAMAAVFLAGLVVVSALLRYVARRGADQESRRVTPWLVAAMVAVPTLLVFDGLLFPFVAKVSNNQSVESLVKVDFASYLIIATLVPLAVGGKLLAMNRAARIEKAGQ